MATATMHGGLFKAFFNDPKVFPPRSYHDDLLVRVDDKLLIYEDEELCPIDSIADDSKVVIECGYIVKQDAVGNNTTRDIVEAYQEWEQKRARDMMTGVNQGERTQATVQLTVEFDRVHTERVKGFIEGIGGTIIKQP